MPHGRNSDRVLDGRCSPREIIQDLPRGEAQLQAVPVTMERHPVTRRGDLGHELRTAADLLTDYEEGRARACARKGVEHGRGSLGVRPVIEGESDAARCPSRRPGQTAGQRQRSRGLGNNRGEGMAKHARMIAETVR
jgi:hypothetical protein